MTENCQTPVNCPFDAVQWGQMHEKLENIHADVLETKTRVTKQNGRIGKLENWQWAIIGGLGVLTFLAPLVLKVLKVL